jgi:OmcA/MtrC family decaheme c-type cytochrome
MYLGPIVLALACEGPTGPRGETGATGATGSQGEPGAVGSQGAPGEDGQPGPEGPRGAQGEQGAQGPAGDDGAQGPQGDPGAEGPEGPEGPAGPAGEDGAPGHDGRSALFTDREVQVEIESVDVDATNHPVLVLRVSDGDGKPLDREGLYTEGTLDLAFTIAVLGDDNRYTNYITRQARAGNVVVDQPTSENNGTLEPMDFGEYVYTFSHALPDGAELNRAHRIAVGVRRTFADGEAGDSATVDFVPNGDPLPALNPSVDDAQCNSCHRGIEGHGGRWTSTTACVTCHTAQNTDPDTGNLLRLDVMVHRIHSGKDLPSVKAGGTYQIIGYRGAVNDYSKVGFPRSTSDCNACHVQGHPGAAEHTDCVSCHDRTSFDANVPDGWTRHLAGPQPENRCAACHPADAPTPGVWAAHADPTKAAELNRVGLHAELVDVTNLAAGAAPSVRFRLTDDAGNAVDPARLDSLEITFSGPVPDNTWTVTASSQQARAHADGDALVVDLASTLPADATGTVAIGMAAYRYLPYGAARADSIGREAADNPVIYRALDGGTPVAANIDVDRANCNHCHADLAAHGGSRRNIEYCQECHTQTATDVARRPADQGPPASITFGPMIHRIHAGARLVNPPIIYGFGNSRNDFSGVVFPGRLNDCQACHSGTAWKEKPSAKLCTACHDEPDAKAHAELQTTAEGVESCGVCHGPDGDFAVDKVHAE